MNNVAKRIILASPDSRHFIQEYIKNIFLDLDYEVFFITLCADLNDKTWKENNVTVYNLKKTKQEPGFKTVLFSPLRLLSFRKSIGKVDIIHYHYIDNRFTRLIDLFFRKSASKSVLTFWGSDLLKTHKKDIKYFRKMFDRANTINVMSDEMLNIFENYTQRKYIEKTIVLDFGNSTLDKISKNNSIQFKSYAKDKYQLPLDKIIVHIGYNGSSSQQHVKIAEVLSLLSEDLKRKIYVVVPFGYSCVSEEYKKKVEDAFYNSGISYRIDSKYLSQDEVVEFRKTADIFLYAQVTDALSCSVIEYLCSGACVIKPSWLDYKELSNMGIEMFEYKSFEKMKELIENVLNNNLANRDENIAYINKVVELKSWSALRPKWLNMYS